MNLTKKLLWGLVRVEALHLEEPLVSLVEEDTGSTHDVYVALWEARLLAEDNDPQLPDFIRTMTRWITMSVMTLEDDQRLREVGITRRIQPGERTALIQFLLTLATQNGFQHAACGRRPRTR